MPVNTINTKMGNNELDCVMEIKYAVKSDNW